MRLMASTGDTSVACGRNVVCGVDLGPGGEEVVTLAAALANELDCPASLIHVTHGARPGAGEMRELRRLGTLVQTLGGRETTDVRVGDPAEELLRAAGEQDAALVAVGSRGLREIGCVLLGSVSSRLMREAPCPVVVVPPGCALPVAGVRVVVVGVDGGDRDAPLLRLAADVGRRLRAAVHAVHAFQVPPPAVGVGAAAAPMTSELRDAAEERLDRAVDHAGVRARRSVVERPAAQALELAAEHDGAGLIVVASQGHGKLHTILHGSVTVRLAAEAPVPVLVLPTDAELEAGTGHYELSEAA